MRDRYIDFHDGRGRISYSDLTAADLSEALRLCDESIYHGDHTPDGARLRIDIERIRRARGW